MAYDEPYNIRIAVKNDDATSDFSSFLTIKTQGKPFQASEPEEDDGLSGAVVAVIVISVILLVIFGIIILWLGYIKKDKEA